MDVLTTLKENEIYKQISGKMKPLADLKDFQDPVFLKELKGVITLLDQIKSDGHGATLMKAAIYHMMFLEDVNPTSKNIPEIVVAIQIESEMRSKTRPTPQFLST